TTRWSDQLEEVLVSSTVGERNPANFSSFESFEHDDDGNLTARIITATGEEVTFVWDDFDRLKRVQSDQNGRMQDARYGVDGLRKRKLDKSGQNSVEYGLGISTSASVPGTVSSTAPRTSYIMGHMIVGAEIDGEFQFFLPDALGSNRDLVDDQGNVVRSFEWDEYGNLLTSSGTGTTSPKTWIGGLSVNDDTADSGMFNMGHRNYSSFLGRFLNRDPIGFAGGLNLYGYGHNNPTTTVDPTGMHPAVGIAIAIGVGAIVGAIFGGLMEAVVGAYTGGTSVERILDSALQGAVYGATATAAALALGPAIAGVAGNGVLGGMLSGGASGAFGEVGRECFEIARGNQDSLNGNDILMSAALGGVFGAGSLRPGRSPSQNLTNWAPSGNPPAIKEGRWVMTGENTLRNHAMSGTARYTPRANSTTGTAPQGTVAAYPPGVEFGKGLFGQRYIQPKVAR
ncbi:MAG: RHS repeat-associated core domain-containing protein, partial [Vulcanimicrobiota bacterium]